MGISIESLCLKEKKKNALNKIPWFLANSQTDLYRKYILSPIIRLFPEEI